HPLARGCTDLSSRLRHESAALETASGDFHCLRLGRMLQGKSRVAGPINISYLRHNSRTSSFTIHLAALVLVTMSLCVNAQSHSSGRISGTVRVGSGAPAPNVTVIVTNQVTGKWKRARSNADGTYAFRLEAGAYRLRVAAPNRAKFDKDKNYGDFAIPRGEALENVIVEAGKDTVIDIPLDQVELKEIPKEGGDKPLGNAGRE